MPIAKCIGCDKPVSYETGKMLYYVCSCGSRILYECESRLFIPAPLATALRDKRNPPHLDYLVGNSSHTSRAKTAILKLLEDAGCIWMKDCKECREDGTLRDFQKWEDKLAIKEVRRILQEPQPKNE